MPERKQAAKYCLRGHLNGGDQTFPLTGGDCRVGSLELNNIVLPRRGVSRHHAVVRLEGNELLVEDLGSKNGTFANNRRVGTARLSLGDPVRFGPVTLYFEEFHRDDRELAISLERSPEERTGAFQTTELSGGGLEMSMAKQWWGLAEAFHSRLLDRPGGDLGAALRLLTEELYLDAACLIEMDNGENPIVLAAAGQLELSATARLKQLYSEAHPPGQTVQEFLFHSTVAGSPPATTFVALCNDNAAPLILALWGTFPGRAVSAPLLRLLTRMLEPCRPRFEPQARTRGPSRFPDLVVPPSYVYGQSELMGQVYRLVERLAPGDLPILIVGETGVGKEFLAQILHLSSPRRSGPFVAINCAAIPAELLESELFGIGEGVATGVAANRGRIQQAQGGTLVLDEIGDMSPDLQAKLLRALQEKEIHPVGRKAVSIDVRVLASTNQDLTRRIESGHFRSDLYYRLAGYVLELPPLRQRPEDIPALVEHFLRACSKDLDRPIRGITVRALRMLSSYPWPGNIRELANEVRRAVYLCPIEGNIESSNLSSAIISHHKNRATPSGNADAASTTVRNPPSDTAVPWPGPMGLGLDSLNLASLERHAVEEAMRRCHNNQVQAAKLLGITRQSLRRRLERWSGD